MATNNVISITPESEIKQFVGEYDVAVCGYGGAGGCACLLYTSPSPRDTG